MEDTLPGCFDDGSIAGSSSRELSSVRGTFSVILFCVELNDELVCLVGCDCKYLLSSGIAGFFLSPSQSFLKSLLVFCLLLFSSNLLPFDLVLDERRLYSWCHVVNMDEIWEPNAKADKHVTECNSGLDFRLSTAFIIVQDVRVPSCGCFVPIITAFNDRNCPSFLPRPQPEAMFYRGTSLKHCSRGYVF